MKTKIKSTISFLLALSLALSFSLSFQSFVFAAEPNEPGVDQIQNTITEEFKAATKLIIGLEECISEAEKKSYIYQIVEEPILPGDKSADSGSTESEFKRRTCYRNNITISPKAIGSGSADPELETYLKKKCLSIEEASQILAINDTSSEISTSYICREVEVLLFKSGTSLIEGYISLIFKWAGSIGIILAVLVITLSGISISAGKDLDEAKGRIGKSLAGLALLFLAWLILRTINPNFFV